MTEKTIVATVTPAPKKAVTKKAKATTPKADSAKKAESKVVADKPSKKSKKAKKNKHAVVKAEVKVKVVRDSFTMPKEDYEKISELKQASLKAGFHVKKSELLRAGLRVLSGLSIAELRQVIDKLGTIKTGRPKKSAV